MPEWSAVMKFLLAVIGLLFHLNCARAESVAPTARLAEYQASIRPILQELCFRCHGSKKQSGDLRLDTVSPDVTSTAFSVSAWHDTLDQINLGEMPPRDETQLSDTQRKQLVAWIAATLNEAAESKRYADGRVLMRRLTRYEYANTVRDLLGIDFDVARELPPEPASPEGFLNNGATLEMSSTQIETYLSAARRALEVAIVSGEEPEVFRYAAAETAVGKLPRSQEGGQIPVNPEFVLDIAKFPRTGEFRLRIRAHAVVPDGEDLPRLRVALGNVPGIIHVPRKLVGEADVAVGPDASQTFEFHGRMEDFPQPGDREFGNVAFKGMVALIDFLDADGNELRYADRTYSDPPPPKNAKAPKKVPPPNGRPAPQGAAPRYDVVIESVEFESPYFESWPPPGHLQLLAHSSDATTEDERAREIVARLMRRAYRRSVTDDELQQTLDLYAAIRPQVPSFEEAIRETLASILVSPHFLYIVEQREPSARPASATDKVRLSDCELATRLSYFLWSTMPDDRLLDIAERGELNRPDVLKAEVIRMLDDKRSNEFLDRFADQWFDLASLERVAVNPEFYPDFDNELKVAMQAETRGVLREIVHNDLSCLELLDSDWTIANRALASHYGLAERPRSSTFERVALKDEDRRGGVLGHAAFLLGQSDGQRAHPIKRAVWILDRLLDSPPAPPPPAVPELDAERADLAKLTIKQQLEVHRAQESCRSCHEGIDPWGFPLEHFDAIGQWRETSPVRIADGRKTGSAKSTEAPAIDAATTLPDGSNLSGAGDLRRYLLQNRREQFARAVVKRLAGYALGRSLDIGDRPEIEALRQNFMASDFRLRQLIMTLVGSELFQTK
jgi:mono/diheme cytochrome c family protein